MNSLPKDVLLLVLGWLRGNDVFALLSSCKSLLSLRVRLKSLRVQGLHRIVLFQALETVSIRSLQRLPSAWFEDLFLLKRLRKLDVTQMSSSLLLELPLFSLAI
jgi:hypothetical protein